MRGRPVAAAEHTEDSGLRCQNNESATLVTVVEPSRPTAHQHPPAHPVQVQPLWFLPGVHKPSCSARLRTRGGVLDLQSFVILRPCLQLHLDKTCLDILVLPSQAQLIKVPFPPPFSIQCMTIPAKLTKRKLLPK